MKTRSQTRNEVKKNEFIFDFDNSSKAWLQNKIRLGNGTYKYKPVDTHSYMRTRYKTYEYI